MISTNLQQLITFGSNHPLQPVQDPPTHPAFYQ